MKLNLLGVEFEVARDYTRCIFRVGKHWLTIPYWSFWKAGCRPEYGVDRDEL